MNVPLNLSFFILIFNAFFNVSVINCYVVTVGSVTATGFFFTGGEISVAPDPEPRDGVSTTTEVPRPTQPRPEVTKTTEVPRPTKPRDGILTTTEVPRPTKPRDGMVTTTEVPRPTKPRFLKIVKREVERSKIVKKDASSTFRPRRPWPEIFRTRSTMPTKRGFKTTQTILTEPTEPMSETTTTILIPVAPGPDESVECKDETKKSKIVKREVERSRIVKKEASSTFRPFWPWPEVPRPTKPRDGMVTTTEVPRPTKPKDGISTTTEVPRPTKPRFLKIVKREVERSRIVKKFLEASSTFRPFWPRPEVPRPTKPRYGVSTTTEVPRPTKPRYGMVTTTEVPRPTKPRGGVSTTTEVPRPTKTRFLKNLLGRTKPRSLMTNTTIRPSRPTKPRPETTKTILTRPTKRKPETSTTGQVPRRPKTRFAPSKRLPLNSYPKLIKRLLEASGPARPTKRPRPTKPRSDTTRIRPTKPRSESSRPTKPNSEVSSTTYPRRLTKPR